MKINICKDFSETLGARYISEGPFSGEEFRDTILIPKYEEAIAKDEKLIIELDGGYGYPTSFLEEAFGGLARQFNPEEVLNTLYFISDDEPSLIEEIKRYISSANQGR